MCLFLDSSFGRHFADEVLNALHAGQVLAAAIDAAATVWMSCQNTVFRY